jgi:hypothetical protein
MNAFEHFCTSTVSLGTLDALITGGFVDFRPDRFRKTQ